jgi:hypothetical protein
VPLESLDEELLEMRKDPLRHAFITTPNRAAEVARLLEGAGVHCRAPVAVAANVVIVCEPATSEGPGVK